MQTRTFGKLGFDVSTFGFGAMRFKTLDGDRTKIDEPLAISLVRKALDSGVNYVDTAYVYHGGFSEQLLAKAFKDGYRQKTKVASKLPGWGEGDAKEWEAKLDESLRRLETDVIDFYLFHGLNAGFVEKKDDLLNFMERMMEKGKILYPSFSFHDEHDAFIKIIDSYDKWGMAQVQFNLMDEFKQAGLKGVEYAGKKGVPVVVMEPLRGGALAKNPPEPVQKLLDAFPVKRSLVEWAFRYVYNRPEVVTILSGLNTMEQLDDNLRIFADAKPGVMTAEELKLAADIRTAYESLIRTGCTACRYCMPCPQGVDIPGIFHTYDEAYMFDEYSGGFQMRMNRMRNEGHGADKCVECGLCEKACPQGIKIIDMLKEADSK